MASLKLIILGTSLLGLTIADPITEAPIPQLHKRQLAACNSFLGIQSSCENETPSFTGLPLTSQIGCLCNPASVFDNAFNSCLGYLSTAETDLYSSFSNLPSSPCAVLNGPASATATTTSSSSSRSSSSSTRSSTITSSVNTDDPNYRACTRVDSSESSCSRATRNFSDLPDSDKASCLCYDGSQFSPERYDTNRESCLSYLQSADPPTYQSLVRNGGAVTAPCASVADSSDNATPRPTTRPNTAAPTGSSTSTTTSSPNVAPTGVAGGVSIAAAAGALALAVFL